MDHDHAIAILIALRNGEKVERRVRRVALGQVNVPEAGWHPHPFGETLAFTYYEYRIAPKPIPKVMMRFAKSTGGVAPSAWVVITYLKNFNSREGEYSERVADDQWITDWMEAPPEIQELQDKDYAATR